VTSRPSRLTIPSSELARMGDAEDRSKAPLVLAHPLLLSGCSKEPSSEAKQSGREARSSPPHNDGVQSTGFSHTVEFSRSLVGIVPGDSPVVPDQVPPPERRPPYLGPSRFVNRATCPPGGPKGRPPSHARGPARSGAEAPAPLRPRHRPDGGSSPGIPGVPLSTLPAFRLVSPPDGPRASAVRTYRRQWAYPSSATWGLWRHLAVSTSYRRTVPRPCSFEASGRPPPAVGSGSCWLSVTPCLSVLTPS
jgi:hypothetical protein